MACEEIQSWSFPALVGAFLDLAIAYLLLCASTSAFLAANFLRLFGLRLPCPCDGLFGDPTGGRCLQRLLVAGPGERIVAVQRAVKGRFPFDAVCSGGDASVKLLASTDGDGGGGGGFLCEQASCVLRRRRRGGGSGLSAHVEGQESSVSSSSGDEQLQRDAELLPSHGLKEERMLLTVNDRMSLDDDVHLDSEQIPAFEVFSTDPDVDQARRIKVLERALEEEKAARAALHQELESERNAAASAADEAMGMIHRLQQEKASIEMEARQFQRLIEEKSAYDEEEMCILKEILVRREREKLVLEKELEAYREMMASEGGTAEMQEGLYDKGYDGDHSVLVEGSGLKPSPYIDDTDDPTILLQQISESIEKKGTVKALQICLDNSPTGRKRGGFKILPSDAINPMVEGEAGDNSLLESLGDITSSFDFEEKNIDSTDGHENGSQKELNTYVSKQGHLHDSNAEPSLAPKGSPNGHKPENSTQVDSCECVSFVNSQAEVESSVLDVHVVDDISQTCNKDTLDRKESSLKHSMSGGSNNWVDIEENFHRSNSDLVGKALEQEELKDKASFLAFRRNSLSAVDHEKFKIKAEVGWLTERLKLVQKGRERLNCSLEIKEKHKLQQLQLLEEIYSQVEEIQSLNPSNTNARRVSLPPPSSKAKSKKRRCRSVSLHESTD